MTVGSVSDGARCRIPNRVVGSAYAFISRVAGDGHCHRLMTGYGLKYASKRGDTSTRQNGTVSHLAGIVAPLDSQTVTTGYTPTGVRDLDGGKRISGCQRHILSDTMGLVLTLFVTSASVLDRNGACLLLETSHRSRQKLRLARFYGTPRGPLQDWVAQRLRFRLLHILCSKN